MQEIRSIAKNLAWFKPIVQKARMNYKSMHKLTDFDQNKMTRPQFAAVLEYISVEAGIAPPTIQETYQLFDEFNDLKNGKVQDYLEKQQFEKFCERLFSMLESIIAPV